MVREEKDCKKHGTTTYAFYTEGKYGGRFRCMKCQAEGHKSTFTRKKQRAIDYLGGSCCKCGYNKCNSALEFHHINPEEKEYEPSKLLRRSWENVINELDKCILVCANCHREIHHNSDIG